MTLTVNGDSRELPPGTTLADLIGQLTESARGIAAGHFRNGILLSAITADAVTALLAGKEPHPAWIPFRPSRFQTPSPRETSA